MDRHQRDREFEEFVAASWPRLRRAAYLLAHDTHDAEDLVQSALARCYAGWGRIRADSAYAYVHRALVNGYIDSTRRRTPVPVDHTTADEPAPGSPTDDADQRSELVELLAPLSPRERSIVVWRYYLDASEQDVAHELGVSVGTVKSTASRALARLRSAHTTTSLTSSQEHR
ncbi:SigE family RNA polymerase sigma factor [Nocardioides currus]|uniref:SigE family RNA polymerase sigma factor n=1 Tax=Nocardioides currus TaxID=2133958 RepID=A0A2R7Z0V3_9ACTN|nr:SigE family RNA polymerase sigma factor [Nocardioides currus]PUA82240.1 SigE family RNA polymerase sigma factor [Nocardioides currus]